MLPQHARPLLQVSRSLLASELQLLGACTCCRCGVDMQCGLALPASTRLPASFGALHYGCHTLQE